MNIAFAFCADKSYKKGLDLLLKTLIFHNPFVKKFDLLLLTDDIVEYKNLKILNCSDIEVDTHVPRFKKTFYKLKLFSLTQYDRVVFIDSDVICLGDISLLISKDLEDYEICAAKDYGIKLNDNIINSGVMVINKSTMSNKTYQEMIDLTKINFDKNAKDNNGNGSDQFIINEYFKNNKKIYYLDIKYNTLKRIFLHHKKLWNKTEKDVRLLHFVGNKPWNKDNKELDYFSLNKKWNDLRKKFII